MKIKFKPEIRDQLNRGLVNIKYDQTLKRGSSSIYYGARIFLNNEVFDVEQTSDHFRHWKLKTEEGCYFIAYEHCEPYEEFKIELSEDLFVL